VLIALILVAAVANLTSALPSIGEAFDAGQVSLNRPLGALGDRYGAKLMLVLGTALAIPFPRRDEERSLLAGYHTEDSA
jgi:MFS transporter, DHA2 family, multidrug resistance protein